MICSKTGWVESLGELLGTGQVYSICSFLFFLDIAVKGRLLFLKLKEAERMKCSGKRKGKTTKTSPQSVESGAGAVESVFNVHGVMFY